MTTDIAILGGGPAGTACALSLRQTFPHLSLSLYESSHYTRTRPGEILSPHAVPLLTRLGVPLQAASEAHSLTTSWGSDALTARHHLFSGHGPALHLQRPRFDRLLAETAEREGAALHLGEPFRDAVPTQQGWLLTFKTLQMTARFVIDATGRRAAFARARQRPVQTDSLTAYTRIFAAAAQEQEQSSTVESRPEGWWYTAPLPGGTRIVSFLTDVDLGRALQAHQAEPWQFLLQQTTHIAPLVPAEDALEATVSPASTARLRTPAGHSWLATGDAAASLDPLAGQGISKALREGVLASYAAADALQSRPGPEKYSALLAAHFLSYKALHHRHHAEETRWPGHPFWQRRHAATPHGAHP